MTSRANSLRYYKPLARLRAPLAGECLSRKWPHQLDIYTINIELHVLLFTEEWGGPQERQDSELSSARMKCIFKPRYSAGDFVGLLLVGEREQ